VEFSTARESAASQYRVRSDSFLNQAAFPRFSWGRFWVLEPDEWETFKSGSLEGWAPAMAPGTRLMDEAARRRTLTKREAI